MVYTRVMKRYVLILLSYFIAVPVYAEGLVTCGKRGQTECGLSDLIGMTNGIVAYLLYIGVFIGVVMISYAGFTLVVSQGNENAMEKAKSRVWNVAVGFIIILLAYLIVSTILTVLTGKGFEKWGIQSGGNTLQNTARSPGASLTPTIGTPTQVSSTDQANRSKLGQAGIRINKDCGAGGTGTCLAGMKQATINRVLALNTECSGCVTAVTGGTETAGGHNCSGTYSHCGGYKIDLRPNAELTSYISSTYSSCGSRGGFCDSFGNEYVRENKGTTGDHWDVSVVK